MKSLLERMLSWRDESSESARDHLRTLSHEEKVALAISGGTGNGNHRHSTRYSNSKFPWLLFLGWIAGVAAITILMYRNDATSLSVPNLLLTLITGAATLALMEKYLDSILKQGQGKGYPAWFSFCVGAAAGMLGRSIATYLVNPGQLLDEVVPVAGMAIPIVINGSIEVGKSLLLERLEVVYGYPVSRPTPEESPLLDLFWTDMERYAFSHEAYLLLQSRKEEEKVRNSKEPFSFMSGSFREDVWVHSKTLFGKGILKPHEWQLLEEFAIEIERKSQPPALVIYLTCNPYVQWKRVQEYCNPPERDAFTLGHLNMLSASHGALIGERYLHSRVLKIPVDEMDFRHDSDALDYVIQDNIIPEMEMLGFSMFRRMDYGEDDLCWDRVHP